MNRRTILIDKAIKQIKRSYPNCILCGRKPVDGAHLIPRNNPAKNNDPTKPENIVSLCRRCHMSYDLNKTMTDRMDFWIENGHIHLAQRIRNLIEP